jgi:amino acid transporter
MVDPESREHSAANAATESPALLRTMGLFSLVVYGVGDMVGSGIYGTIGKAAGSLGNAVWLAFLVSMIAAIITGLSYASLASRYPRAAGAAYVTHRAFHYPFLSYAVGLTVAASGLTSMATQTNVFADNLVAMFGGSWLIMGLLFLGVMTAINLWGIRQSMWANLLCTVVEVGGLVFIIAVGARYWGDVNYLASPHATFDANGNVLSTGLRAPVVLSGAVLTFFSFMGFEDMLNVAEEVKEPHRTMPWGIVLSLGVVTALYLGIAVTAVSVVDYRDLAPAPAPLQLIADRAAPWLPSLSFSVVTLFAVANTMLINFIMGSRLLYGMARQGLLPAFFGRVHAKRRTPHVAIFTLLILVLVLALCGGNEGVKTLASATALLLILAFIIVNMALVLLKRRASEPAGAFEVPLLIPILGVVVNALLIIARLAADEAGYRAPIIAGIIVSGIIFLYFACRPVKIDEKVLAAAEHETGDT